MSDTTPMPRALVVWPGDMMDKMLRPNVPEPLLSQTVDVDRARSDTVVYADAFLANFVHVDLLGVPPNLRHPDIDALAKRYGSRLTVHRDEEFARWINTAAGADGVFPEDWGRYLTSQKDGRTHFVCSHMTATSRIGEHRVGVETATALGLICCDQALHILEIDPEARCESGDILELRPNRKKFTFLGLSERTNDRALDVWHQLTSERDFGPVYPVRVFPNVGLHLTTAAGMLDYRTVLFDPTLVSGDDLRSAARQFDPDSDLRFIETAPADHGKQNAANCVRFPTTGVVAMDNRFDATIELVRSLGYQVITLPNEQHAIGAGGLTCRSLRQNWYPVGG